jgi:hypothetical protein
VQLVALGGIVKKSLDIESKLFLACANKKDDFSLIVNSLLNITKQYL